MPDRDFSFFIGIAVAIFFGIGLHEYAHAKLADMAGDPTPGIYGRVTLKLWTHFEMLGTIMIILSSLSGFGIGWGKPVPMDPRKMRNPKWDHFVAVIGGPLTNFMLAIVSALVLRGLNAGQILTVGASQFLTTFMIVNLSLFLFNLLPIGPLDGMWIIGTFMPEKMRFQWTRFNLQIGSFLFIGIVLLGQLNPDYSVIRRVLWPLLESLVQFLLGR
ncbi:MAG: site-2 protease family protein [Fimbriimonadaceae bacterium]|nr:site-2 protease family protein [Fimbriimonadaceae bacterium]